MIKSLVRKLFKDSEYVKSRYLYFLHRYDIKRYLDFSGMNEDSSELSATKMRLLIHPLEKALSLENIRPNFGKDKVIRLISLYEEYSKINGKDQQVLKLAESIILNYIDFQKQYGMDLSFIPEKFFNSNEDKSISGTINVSKEEFEKLSDFEKISTSRHSIRSFSPEKINRDKIISAVKLAQTAPSACNRQSTRVYVCDNPEKIQSIMSNHKGMNGFTNTSAILAITGDLNLYENEYERNTIFVDGGIFIMNLLYSLQSQGIANCPIIWGNEPDKDNFLYNLLKIPESETIILLVMVGCFPEMGVKAAKSYKRDTLSILKFTD